MKSLRRQCTERKVRVRRREKDLRALPERKITAYAIASVTGISKLGRKEIRQLRLLGRSLRAEIEYARKKGYSEREVKAGQTLKALEKVLSRFSEKQKK